MNSNILFVLSENNTIIGVGTCNNKYLVITSDLDGQTKYKDKLKPIKILDTFHYNNIIKKMFDANNKASIIYITRSDYDSEDIEVVLTITREEYKLISKLYYD